MIDFAHHSLSLTTKSGTINLVLDGQSGLLKFNTEPKCFVVDVRLVHTAVMIKGSEEDKGGMLLGFFVEPFWVKCWETKSDNMGYTVEVFLKHLLAAHTQHRRRTPQPSPQLDDYVIVDDDRREHKAEEVVASPWRKCQLNHEYSVLT